MFDPDDNKRTPRRRSLLDLAPAEGGPRLRVGSRSQAQHSLLDRLAETEHAEASPRRSPKISIDTPSARRPEPEPQRYEPLSRSEVRQPLTRRLSRWLSGVLRNDDPQPQRGYDPALVARAETPQRQVVQTQASEPFEAREPAPDSDYSSNADRPLIDLALVIRSVWKLRALIVATTILGAIAGVLLAMATPNKYVSESRLYVDPREVRLTDSDLSNQALATEAILAIIDSQMQVLSSRKVLEKVSTELGLERDAEFGGKTGTGAAGSGLSLLREMIFGKAPAEAKSNHAEIALEKLQSAITVARDEKTFIVAVRVTTHDAAKSALIANRLVATFLNEESDAQSGFFRRTTTALDGRIAELRKELDAAETAVEKYKADNDIVGADGKLISENQLVTLNDQVGAAVNRVAEARSKTETASRIQLDDVLTGAFPEEVSSITLAELRKQYATAKADFGSLSTRLGPRHPERLAAEQALETTRGEIRNELRRIAGAAQTEFQRATETQADLNRQLAVQKARQVNASSDFVKLRELERDATATRTIYESFLKRARETGEEQKLTSRNIRVISQAEPALQASGPSRKIIAIGGLIAGLFGGIGIGVLLGIYRSLLGPARSSGVDTIEFDDTPTDRPPGGGRRDLYDLPPELPGRYPEPAYDRRGVPSRFSGGDPVTAEREPELPRPARRDAAIPVEPLSFSQSQPYYGFAGVAGWPVQAATPPRQAQEDRRPAPDEGVRRVHDDLRALRARVETYSRQNGRSRG